jgi:hypothetical protein
MTIKNFVFLVAVGVTATLIVQQINSRAVTQ